MLWVFAALACRLRGGEPPAGDALIAWGDDHDGDGYAQSVDDCDDHDEDVHPGAHETCGNGRDDNCNGTPDGCDWSGEHVLVGTELSGTEAHSAMGASLAVCDANGDDVDDVVTVAPYYDDVAGAVYVFYGPITADRDATHADYTLLGGEENQLAGLFVECRRDVDGDGIADVLVGEPSREVGGTGGKVYVVPGGGVGRDYIASGASSVWTGADSSDRLGYDLVAIAADDDPTDELAAAVGPNTVGPNRFGAVYVFDDAEPGVHDSDDAAAYVYGAKGDRVDFVVGNAGDLDGDGWEELVVTGNDRVVAEVLVFRAPFVGPISKSDADARIVGGEAGDVWSGIGQADLDNDGRDDLFVANPNDRQVGKAYAFFSPIEQDTNVADADMGIAADEEHYDVGSDVTSPGDVDGDGAADLLVGAPGNGGVFLLYGGGAGAYDLATDAQAWWQSGNEASWAGGTIGAGDVTGDGIVEFVIGAANAGEQHKGSITIVPGFRI